MTLRTRLVGSVGGIALLMVLPALFGASQLARLRDIAEELHARHAASFLALGQLQASLAEMELYERSYLAAPNSRTRQGLDRALASAHANLAQLGETGFGAEAHSASVLLDTLEASSRKIEALVEARRMRAAAAYLEALKPRLAVMRDSLRAIASSIERRGAADVVQAQDISAAASSTTLLASLVAILIAFLWGLATTDALTRPLRRLQRATSTVAGGEFVVPPDLPYARSDEIGALARSFRCMTTRLAELDRLKAEFISVATHELKTPISVIAGYSELLENGTYGELSRKQREVLTSMCEQTQGLTRLVNDLLDMSRLEAGGLHVELVDADLPGLLEEMYRFFEPLARQKRVELALSVEASTPRSMPLDAPRVREQLLGNLVSNALKFTPASGRIEVRSWGDKAAAYMEVSDTGVGIPPQDLPHIFERYYQVGTEARSKGAGLGLSIARGIAEAHHGRIQVQSTPGRGTTFHISLPLPATAGAATAPP